MKLDLLYEVDVPKPWKGGHPWGQRREEQRAYREALEQIQLADRLGFHTIWAVEHHFREGRSHCPTPEVFLGALSQITQQLRLGFGVTLTPFGFTPPQRIAEKVATVDILSEGRVEWGTGRSTPMEQKAFGVDAERSRQDWREAIEIVCGMWREEYFEYESERFSFPRRMVTPKPYQVPHPPAWMAATSQGTAQTAGSAGLGMLSLSLLMPLEWLAEQVEEYRRAAANPKPITDVTTNKVAAYTLVHCNPTMQRTLADPIWNSISWWYRNLAEFQLEWEPEMKPELFPLLKALRDGETPIEPFDEADMIVVGDPDRCFEKMKRYAELGVDQLICYVQFGDLTHDSIMSSLELIGREILPEIDKIGPKSV